VRIETITTCLELTSRFVVAIEDPKNVTLFFEWHAWRSERYMSERCLFYYKHEDGELKIKEGRIDGELKMLDIDRKALRDPKCSSCKRYNLFLKCVEESLYGKGLGRAEKD